MTTLEKGELFTIPAGGLAMNIPRRTRWAAAMRSGRWLQANGELRDDTSPPPWRYCCLGVATDLAVFDGVLTVEDTPLTWEAAELEDTGVLSSAVIAWMEVNSENPVLGWYPNGNELTATAANDEEDFTLEEIADMVEGITIPGRTQVGERPDHVA